MFPNEDYMKTALHGISNELKHRPVAYEKYDTHTVSAKFSPDKVQCDMWYGVGGNFALFRVSNNVVGLKDAIKNRNFSVTALLNKEQQSQFDSAKWIVTDDYAYMDIESGGGYPISNIYKIPMIMVLFGTTPPFSFMAHCNAPGVYIAAASSNTTFGDKSGAISSITWTYKTPRYVQIPQKLLDTDQSDWQQNDPTAPDYIKNRVGGYDVSKTMEMSAEFSPDAVEYGFWHAYAYTFALFRVSENISGLKDAIKNKTFSLASESSDKEKYADISNWVITDDYAYIDTEKVGGYPTTNDAHRIPYMLIIFSESQPFDFIPHAYSPGIYLSASSPNETFTSESSAIKSISWTYTETEPVKIPQKYLPDPEPRDTLVVKFRQSDNGMLIYEADHTYKEILNAYTSGAVFIKGTIIRPNGDMIIADAPMQLNLSMHDIPIFKFSIGETIIYILMTDSDFGVMVSDSVMLCFESDDPFSLAVNTPGWDGKMYVYGSEWNGAQANSLYIDGKERLYICGEGNNKVTGQGSNHEFVLTGSNIHAKGSVERLRNPDADPNTMSGYCYAGLFKNATALVEAPELTATNLSNYCYDSMFYGCTSLSEAPELPATTLASGCYQSMFDHCTSLAKAPKLPATTLASGCYQSMFNTCLSLAEAPELPATTLANNCYYGAFAYCKSFIKAPKLPATTLASGCYKYMFSYCLNLIRAPELPATTLASGCYQSMFNYCVSLRFSTAKTDDYPIEYRIPKNGTAFAQSNAFTNMFVGTGGTFTGTPTINTTYYLHKSCGIVGMTDDPKPVPKTDEMTQPVGMDKWTGELFTKPGGSGSGSASIDLGITGATTGQVAKVKTVDDAGKPTEWEAATIEKGDKGDDGAPGIVISETEPTDETHPVWLNPNGDVTILPSGGRDWELIAEQTVEEEVQCIEVSVEKPYKNILIIDDMPQASVNGSLAIDFNGVRVFVGVNSLTNTTLIYTRKRAYLFDCAEPYVLTIASLASLNQIGGSNPTFSYYPYSGGAVTSIQYGGITNNVLLPVGTSVKFYGR